jgi:hypothetical protein
VLGLTSSSDESTARCLVDSSSASNAVSIDSGTITAQISSSGPNSNSTVADELAVYNLMFEVAGATPSTVTTVDVNLLITGPTGDFGLLDLENNAFECMGGDACSESYNEAISLTLPSGVTYTSDSPTFLTASSAPEPSTLSLFALGGIAALIRMTLRRPSGGTISEL